MCIQVVFSEGFILVKFSQIFSVTTKALCHESSLSARCQVPANTEALEILIETLKLYKYWQNWVFPPFTLKRRNYFCLCLPEKKKLPEGKTHCGALQSK